MIPVKAFPVAISMLKGLYKTKKKIGRGSKIAAGFAAKKGFGKTSQFISGVSKKTHKGTRAIGRFAKRNPKEASFQAGGATVLGIDALIGKD